MILKRVQKRYARKRTRESNGTSRLTTEIKNLDKTLIENAPYLILGL
jgi:hypothetical protein